MEKKKWCKIITLENGEDVLVVKETSDDEEENPVVKITMELTVCRAGLSLEYKTDEEQDDAFEMMTKEKLSGVYQELSDQFT
jgi:hypothetical protein